MTGPAAGDPGRRLQAALHARAGLAVVAAGASDEAPSKVGPYRVLGRLGEGGMGVVYLGEDAAGNRAALKVIRARLAADPGFRHRFRSEIDAARVVRSRHVAALIDADAEAERPWLATALLEGPTLDQRVAGEGPLAPADVAGVGARLAEALAAIHAASVVHRDLKPANVILTADGPCVVDFGIARALEAAPLTVTGTLVGSPEFASPEQVTGGEVGPPADLFSLGSTLVFAATGSSPFTGAGMETVMWRVANDRADLSGLHPSLADAVRPLLARRPGKRPAAADVASRLHRLTAALQSETGFPPPPRP